MRPLPTLAQISRQDGIDALRRPLNSGLFRRLFGYTRPYRRIVAGLLVLLLIRAIQLPLLAWTLSYVIKGPIAKGDTGALAFGVALYAAVGLLTSFVLFHRSRLALLLGEHAIHDLRNELFARLQQMTMSFFHNHKLGRLISRMTSDAEALRLGLQNAVFATIVCAGQMLIAATIMLCTDWGLFALVLATSPLYYLAYQYFRGRIIQAKREVQASFSRVTGNLAESVTGFRVTQGFVREDVNARLFQGLVVDHAEYNMNVARAAGTFTPVIEMMGSLLVGAVFVIGGYRLLHPGFDARLEDLFVFFFLLGEVLAPLVAIGNHYTTALTAMAGAERVFALLDRKPDFADASDAIDLPSLRGRVEFRNFSFAYVPGRPVLREISFTAEPGQTVALVGHTGSGKTTIISLMAKFYPPTQGEILIDGHDIRSIRGDSLHRRMGVVLQQNFLFTGTVMENIRLGRPEAAEEEVVEAARALDVQDLIEALPSGFHTEVGERGAGLSLGQRQIICFVRAMLADPTILILDEATSSVDAITESRIQKALSTLLAGRTSLVVAHRLSTVRHADLVLVLAGGRIVERGTHVHLLASGGLYSDLYQDFIGSARNGRASR